MKLLVSQYYCNRCTL